jgi:transposase, IS30 family
MQDVGSFQTALDFKERPKIVDEKTRIGDWELDSIIGAKHRGAITSIVDRKSKRKKLVLLEDPTAKATSDDIIKHLKPIKTHVHKLTFDNCKEFAKHAKITKKLEANFYFCKPYHSWERGLNENTNGLVRKYFPKGMDFSNATHQDLKNVKNLLKNRPNKSLGFLTPNQVFNQLTNNQSNYALHC